ncbi:MAG: matrixin family metalloprotease [Phormidesmis sp.]
MLNSLKFLPGTSRVPASGISISHNLLSDDAIAQLSGTHLGACSCTHCVSETVDVSEHNSQDFSSDGTVVEEDFAFQSSNFLWQQPKGKGSPITITYSFTNLFNGGINGGITNAEMKSAVQEAFTLWSRYAPLNFVEIKDIGLKSRTKPNAADIRIGHDDLGGPGGTLGRANLRYDGELAVNVAFDNRDQWETDRIGNKSDFLVVATHEIGHALGLRHEVTRDAVMFPSARDIYSGLGSAFLYEDDINGIRAVYGNGRGSVTPLSRTSNPSPNPSPNPGTNPVSDRTINGTQRNDLLRGNNQAQTLNGRGGNDTIKAGGGNDILLGSSGNDRLLGQGGRDVLTGARTSGNRPGFQERDVLIGGGDRDVFVLGDRRKVFYDDGIANSAGRADYALIRDFNKNSGDKIQLKGRAADYRLGSSPNGNAQWIFLKTESKDELIGVVKGNNGLSLQSSAFTFV